MSLFGWVYVLAKGGGGVGNVGVSSLMQNCIAFLMRSPT